MTHTTRHHTALLGLIAFSLLPRAGVVWCSTQNDPGQEAFARTRDAKNGATAAMQEGEKAENARAAFQACQKARAFAQTVYKERDTALRLLKDRNLRRQVEEFVKFADLAVDCSSSLTITNKEMQAYEAAATTARSVSGEAYASASAGAGSSKELLTLARRGKKLSDQAGVANSEGNALFAALQAVGGWADDSTNSAAGSLTSISEATVETRRNAVKTCELAAAKAKTDAAAAMQQAQELTEKATKAQSDDEAATWSAKAVIARETGREAARRAREANRLINTMLQALQSSTSPTDQSLIGEVTESAKKTATAWSEAKKTTGLDTETGESETLAAYAKTSQEAIQNAQGSSEAALAAGLSLAKMLTATKRTVEAGEEAILASEMTTDFVAGLREDNIAEDGPVLAQSGAILGSTSTNADQGAKTAGDTLEYASQTAMTAAKDAAGLASGATDPQRRMEAAVRATDAAKVAIETNQLAGEFVAMLKTAAASGAAIQAASTSAAKVQDSMTEAIKYAMQAGKISSVLLQSVAEAGATEAEGATTLEGVQAAVKKVSSVDDSAAVLAASVELTGGSLSSGVRDIVTVNETTAETKRVKAATAEALRRANAAVAKLSVALGITQPPREPTVTELPVNPVTSVPVKTPDPATVTPIVTAITPAAAVTKNSGPTVVLCIHCWCTLVLIHWPGICHD
ncbi:hypothetical protein BV898_14408 [Hypsibius exemplaris]|uniref:Uncharacterized protein n=1 Tax=Hypsibius exemplaris TaxID=2072580 RepID=A0A9X6NFK9_HYPEX|nr:hypothetical protein BV898_14408 [Hypsibius exemplaris]